MRMKTVPQVETLHKVKAELIVVPSRKSCVLTKGLNVGTRTYSQVGGKKITLPSGGNER